MNRAYRTARLFLVLSALAFACGPTLGVAETPGEIPKPWTYEGSMKLQEQQRQQDQQFQHPQQSPQGSPRMAPGGSWNSELRRPMLHARSGKSSHRYLRTVIRCSASGRVPLRPGPIPTIPSLSSRRLPRAACAKCCSVAVSSSSVRTGSSAWTSARANRSSIASNIAGMRSTLWYCRRPPETDRVRRRRPGPRPLGRPELRLGARGVHAEGGRRVFAGEGDQCSSATRAPAHSSTGGVLSLSVSAASSTDNVSGRKLWVLKADPQVALIKGGLTSTPDGTVLQHWMRACSETRPGLRHGRAGAQTVQRGYCDDGRQGTRADAAVARRSLLGTERCQGRRQAADVEPARRCEGVPRCLLRSIGAMRRRSTDSVSSLP